MLHIFQKTDRTNEVSFIDQSLQIWYAEIYPGKFKWLREGQFVKVKGASKYKQVDPYTLGLKFSSNILTLPSDSKIVESLKNLNIDECLKVNAQLMLADENLQHNIIATRISEKAI